jgi:hypothetical protein
MIPPWSGKPKQGATVVGTRPVSRPSAATTEDYVIVCGRVHRGCDHMVASGDDTGTVVAQTAE